MGKDILRFHAVYWPAMLMAAGEEPPKCVFAHGWLLVGGEKMSKTRLNQIAPADLIATFGVDGFRHHLLRDQAFGPDGDFSYEAMLARYNADLANNFGNLVNRVLTMACELLGEAFPPTPARTVGSWSMPSGQRKSWMRLWPLLIFPVGSQRCGDRFTRRTRLIEDRRPWALHKEGQTSEVAGILGDCLEVLRIVASSCFPADPLRVRNSGDASVCRDDRRNSDCPMSLAGDRCRQVCSSIAASPSSLVWRAD